MTNNPQKVWSLLLLQCTVTLVKGLLVLLWRLGKEYWALPQGDLDPFHSRGSGSGNWLNPGNWLKACDSVFMLQVWVLFTWARTLLLIQMKYKFSSFPCTSFLLWSNSQFHRSSWVRLLWLLLWLWCPLWLPHSTWLWWWSAVTWTLSL